MNKIKFIFHTLSSAFIVVFIFIPFKSICQNTTVTIQVVDSIYHTPVKNATLLSADGKLMSESNSSGNISVSLTAFNNNKYLLVFCDGYKIDTITNIKRTIYLSPLNGSLPEYVFKDKLFTRVLRSPYEYVVDYEFVNNNIIVASYSGNGGGKAKLFLLTPSGDTLSMTNIPEEPLQLFKSCINKYYCVCKNKYYPLEIKDNIIKVSSPRDTTSLFYLRQCQIYKDDNFYLKIFNKTAFRVSFLRFKNDTLYRAFQVFKNNAAAIASWEENMHLLRYPNINIYGTHVLWNNVCYAYLDATLFDVHDTLLLFDFRNKLINKYNLSGSLQGNVPMHFKWNDILFVNVLQDPITGKLYLHRFSNSSAQTLEEINLDSGVLGPEEITIPKQFAEDVKIYNGKAYFLWQEKNNGVTKQLFVENKQYAQ